MDPVQSRALDALEPFVALSKSANSLRAAADLVTRATSAPNTYVFAELLQTPNIQALGRAEEPEFPPFLTFLEIFAWGTWKDYTTTIGLPPLNDAQTKKLRLLSLLPLCASAAPLTYSYLQNELGLANPRTLEDLIISATYAGLLSAKLSPSNKTVQVSSVAPLRDLAPGSVPRLAETLDAWDARCTALVRDLQTQIGAIKTRAAERRRRDSDLRAATVKALQAALGGADKGSGKRPAANEGAAAAGARDGDEHMDVDDAGDARGGAGGSGGGGRGQRKNARTKFGGVGRRLG
ncbi:MAG: hypothetical protein M1832_004938 [Thelocarpon impressellum]|nr:MAG: hypothetical protein M1832_004938 [Thelocarpon impressellum]